MWTLNGFVYLEYFSLMILVSIILANNIAIILSIIKKHLKILIHLSFRLIIEIQSKKLIRIAKYNLILININIYKDHI